MKAQNTILAVMLIALMGMLGTACSSDSSTSTDSPAAQSIGDDGFPYHKLTPDELDAYFAAAKVGASAQATVEYEAHLCPDDPVTGEVRGRFNSPNDFVFYSFTGVAGGTVTINVDRNECGLDPGMTLCKGTTTTTAGIRAGSFLFNNADLTWLALNDDTNTPDDCPSPCAQDPEIVYDIEEDGDYTIMVYRFGTCNSSTDDEFTITVTGDGVADCSNDTDGDGFDDDEDDYPESDDRAEVQIDGCDSGVDNIAVGNGAFMMDIINYCAENAGNHGEFVSCVNYYANEWKAAGLITGNQKASIGSCASTSSLP